MEKNSGRLRIFTRKRGEPEPLSLPELYEQLQDVGKIVRETVPRPKPERDYFAVQMLEKKPKGFGTVNLAWAWLRFEGKNFHAPFKIASISFDMSDSAMRALKAWHDQPTWDSVPPRPALWEARPNLDEGGVPTLSTFRHQYPLKDPHAFHGPSHHYPFELHHFYTDNTAKVLGTSGDKDRALAYRPRFGEKY